MDGRHGDGDRPRWDAKQMTGGQIRSPRIMMRRDAMRCSLMRQDEVDATRFDGAFNSIGGLDKP